MRIPFNTRRAFLFFSVTILSLPLWAANNAPFITGSTYPTGKGPDALAVGDFNGDGQPDTVVADRTAARISVYLTKAGGGFAAAVSYPVSGGPRAIAVADVNGDGKLDIVAAGGGNLNGNVNVLLGNGDGTFQPAVDYELPFTCFSLAVADFNGDGHPDLAVSGYTLYHNGLSVLLNKGNGTFQIPAAPTLKGSFIQIIAADFNGDGKQDLLLNGGYLALGNGDGTFLNPSIIDNGAMSAAVADFNGDGKLDIVSIPAPEIANGILSVQLGNGDGTFQPPVSYSTFGQGAVAVLATDLNGDGKADLVAIEGTSSDFAILLGNGNGTFQASTTYAAGLAPVAMAAADFNGDKKIDLAAVGGYNQLHVFFGNGDGTLQSPHTFLAQNLSDFGFTTQPTIGDFNNDGLNDIVVPDTQIGAAVLINAGGGNFHQPVHYGPLCAHVAVGDFNSDGNLDMVSVGQGINIFLGNGDGTFRTGASFETTESVAGAVVGDFNKDGKADIAAVDFYYGKVYVLLGNGDGTFQTPVVYNTLQSNLAVILEGDLNGDGSLDLYVTGYNDKPTAGEVLIGKRDGRFAPAIYSGDIGGMGAVLEDFNGDGILDIAEATDSDLQVAFGKGDGTFLPATSYNVPGGPRSVAAADLNGDGHLDLVVTGLLSSDVLYGSAGGAFKTPLSIPNTFYYGVNLGDLNGDGWPDLVALGGGANSIEVALNPLGSGALSKYTGVKP
jgi:hypothetical protein